MTGAAVKAFEVLTEFRFDVGSAVAGSSAMVDSINAISLAADNAMSSVQYMGASFAASMGISLPGLGGSLLGFLGMAVSSAEKLNDTAATFANIMSANRDKLTGPIDTFNQRMGISEKIIGRIVDQAAKFGLPEQELLQMTKLITVPLVNKGLAGENFETGIDISRNLLKAAPSMGLHTGEIEGQLMRLMEGAASMGDTLFRRLAQDTDAMSPFAKAGGTKEFNTKDAATRIDLLRKALGQFTADSDVLSARFNSIGNQVQILKDKLTGLRGILIPIGQVIRTTIVGVLLHVNATLETSGRQIGASVAKLMKPFLEDPRKLIVSLLQLRQLGNDIKRTESTLGIGGALMGIGWVLSKITRIALFANPIFAMLAMGFSVITDVLGRVNNPVVNLIAKMLKWALIIGAIALILAKFGVLGAALVFIFNAVLVPFLILFAIFQLISRAVGIAQLNDAEALPSMVAKITDAALKLSEAVAPLIAPFTEMFDTLAHLIAPLFETSGWISLIADALYLLSDALKVVATVLTYVFAAISGLMEGFLNVAQRIADFSFADILTGKADFQGAFTDGFKEEYSRYLSKASLMGKPGEDGSVNNTSSHVTNIGKVEVRQDFKENMEPDRIAASFVKVIGELGKNPTQASGRSFSGGLVR